MVYEYLRQYSTSKARIFSTKELVIKSFQLMRNQKETSKTIIMQQNTSYFLYIFSNIILGGLGTHF